MTTRIGPGNLYQAISAAVVIAIVATAPAVAQNGHAVRSRGVEVVRPTAQPSPAPAPAPPRQCPRPLPSSIAMSPGVAQPAFDRALRAQLAPRPARVVVDLVEPFPLGAEGPAQLAPWLAEAKAKGGLVSIDQYCEAARGLFSFLRKLFGGGAQDNYAVVDGYDVVLHADGAIGKVTQVEFRLRTGA